MIPRIGIDLGGSKIAGVVFDAAGNEGPRQRLATPPDYEGTLAAIAVLVATLERGLDRPATVGVGIPGITSPATGLVENANAAWLIGHALDRDLEARLGRPVRVANDANCFALSEAVDGAGTGAAVVFGVIAGTGTGGGIVVHGRPLTGHNAIADEWGHNPLPWPEPDELPGRRCYCGKCGCIETFLSGPGLAADHAVARPRGGRRDSARRGGDRTPRRRRRSGSGRHDGALREAHGEGVGDDHQRARPDVIVLGGARLYRTVPQHWGAYTFSDVVRTRLVPAQHGDSGGVRGAAWLWPPTDED